MIKDIIKGMLILLGIGITIFVGYITFVVYALGGFDKDYSVTDLKANFEKNKTEIYELKEYFNGIVPKNTFVEIEFEDGNTLSRFGISTLDSTATGDRNRSIFLEWNLKIESQRTDAIISQLGWTRETLETLKKKLDMADCIQIKNGEPTKIGFKRSGMGMYSFNVFDEPIPESLRKQYDDGCAYILASDKLVLEYGGGAIGNQCFYNKD